MDFNNFLFIIYILLIGNITMTLLAKLFFFFLRQWLTENFILNVFYVNFLICMIKFLIPKFDHYVKPIAKNMLFKMVITLFLNYL